MPELIPITIFIGDRNYRIKVDPVEEESVRKTIKLINEKIIEFKTLYAGKDMQDYIAMVLTWYATQNAQEKSMTQGGEELSTALEGLENMLDQSLPG